VSPRSEGRHRVADGAVADPPAETDGDEVARPLAVTPAGPFTVQRLNGQWFIGSPGAAQRIEDAPWLDTWLAANGSTGHHDLDFAGDRALQQRFAVEFGARRARATTDPTQIGEPE
jgi:hypothetical protein